MFGAHYTVLTNSDHLEHHGVKGMRWGKHLFGLKMETDTGTRTKEEGLDEHMKKYFANRDAKFRKQLEDSARKQEAARRAAAEAEAEKEASKKKKKSGSGRKKAASKAKSTDDETEETNEEQKVEETKTPDLPAELVEKLQDLNAELTPEEIKMRSENGVAKAKELIATLPSDPTEDDIYALLDKESDKRGTGYDAFTIGIAIDTAMITLMNKRINDPNSDDKTVADAQQKRSQHEQSLKNSLKTGKASY